MTAPARSRAPAASRKQKRSRSPAHSASAGGAPFRREGGVSPRRSSAAERAYARKAQRVESVQQRQSDTARRTLLPRPRSRTSFVLVLMALMVAGVAASLWLSTQAIAGSYQLEELREENARLIQEAEQLQREVSQLEAAPSLVERAESLGMVPGGNPARLIQEMEGTTRMMGEPVPATEPESTSEDSESAEEDSGEEDSEAEGEEDSGEDAPGEDDSEADGETDEEQEETGED